MAYPHILSLLEIPYSPPVSKVLFSSTREVPAEMKFKHMQRLIVRGEGPHPMACLFSERLQVPNQSQVL